MSHTRPTGTGWVAGQQGEPVEIMADPPGDAIGPDLTPPDQIPGQDKAEFKRLEKDHRAAVKDYEQSRTNVGETELYESAAEPATQNPFAAARVSEPQDPRVEVAPDSDPRRGKGDR